MKKHTPGVFRFLFVALTAACLSQPAFATDASGAKVAFEEGTNAFAVGNLERAAQKFEEVLKLNPDHDRARLELGRTYYSLGRYEEARGNFLTVLKHNPPDAVKLNIQLFLDRIDREANRFNVNARASVGVLYDDNVNVGPASDLIRIRPTSFGGVTLDTLSVAPDTQPQESWGILGEASVYAQYDTGNRGDWFMTGGADYYQTWLDQHTDREIFYGDLFAGVTRLTPKKLLNIPARYAHIDQGSDPLVNILGVAPSYNVACDEDTLCSTALVGEYRDYDEVDERDSLYGELRYQMTKLFDARSKSLTAALGGFYEDADTDVNSNIGLSASLGGSLSLPLNSRLDVRGGYRGSWYDEREALAPDTREDDEFQALAQLSKQFDENWSMALMHQFTTRESNFDLYDYDRNFVTLRAICSY